MFCLVKISTKSATSQSIQRCTLTIRADQTFENRSWVLLGHEVCPTSWATPAFEPGRTWYARPNASWRWTLSLGLKSSSPFYWWGFGRIAPRTFLSQCPRSRSCFSPDWKLCSWGLGRQLFSRSVPNSLWTGCFRSGPETKIERSFMKATPPSFWGLSNEPGGGLLVFMTGSLWKSRDSAESIRDQPEFT